MRSFAGYLLERGAVDARAIDRALERQVLLGGDLGSHLLGTRAIDEASLLGMLSGYHGLPAGPAGRLPSVSPELGQLLPVDIASRFGVFPIGMALREIHVATEHALPAALLRELGDRVGRTVWQVVVCPLRLREAWWRHASQPLAIALRDTLELLDGTEAVEDGPNILGPRAAGVGANRGSRPYRRMVETPEHRIMPADRSTSVSLLSAMVASRLGAASNEEDPLVECSEGEPFEEVELSDEIESAEFATEPSEWDQPSGDSGAGEPTEDEPSRVLDARRDRSAASGARAHEQEPVARSVPDAEGAIEGPATERDGAGLLLSSEPAAPRWASDGEPRRAAASELGKAAARDAGGAEAPVLVEWKEVAALIELGGDAEAIQGSLSTQGGPAAEETEEPDEPITRVTQVAGAERAGVRPPSPAEPAEQTEEPDEPITRVTDVAAARASREPAEGPAALTSAPSLEEASPPEPATDGGRGETQAEGPDATEPEHGRDDTGPSSLEIELADLRASPLAPSLPSPSLLFLHRGPMPRATAEVALETCQNVGQVLDVFMRFARQYFERTVLWTVQGGRATVRQSYGMPGELPGVELELAEPSLLKRAHDEAGIVIDVPAGGGFDERLRTELGLGAEVRAVALPIRVRGRVVALLHADDVRVDVDSDAVAEVAGFSNLVGNSLASLIVRRKKQRTP